MNKNYQELLRTIEQCKACSLYKERNQVVPGEGSLTADIMLVGEAPGAAEDRDRYRRPFVGPAGKFLDELLASINLRREDIFITNILCCRPPKNRDPFPAEIAACHPYLEKKVAIIDPRILVTLGRYSLGHFFPGTKISKARGIPKPWKGRLIYPVYHPAAGLHNPNLKDRMREDFLRIPNVLKQAQELSPVEEDGDGPKIIRRPMF